MTTTPAILAPLTGPPPAKGYENLNITHPSFSAKEQAQLAALYEGGSAWRALLYAWLPKHHGEEAGVTRERHDHALYDNKLGPVVDTFHQWLFEDPIVVEGPDLKAGENSREFGQVVSEAFRQALIHRHGWVYLRHAGPADGDEPATSRAQQKARGELAPVYVALNPLSVIDWELDDRGRVLSCVIREVISTRAGPLKPRVEVVRWTYESAMERVVWEVELKENESSKELTKTIMSRVQERRDLGREVPLEACPVLCLELPKGLWAAHRMRDVAVGHTRTSNVLDWSLDRAAFALLVLGLKDAGLGRGSPKVGIGYSLPLDTKNGETAEFIEPAGNSTQALADRVVAYEQAIYRSMRQMAYSASTNSKQPASGASKVRDMDPMRTVLAAYRVLVVKFVERAARAIAAFRGDGLKDSDEVKVQGLDSWRERTLVEFFEAVSLAGGLLTVSDTAAKEAAKSMARFLFEGTKSEGVLPTVLEEIEAADMTPMGMDFVSAGDQAAADAKEAAGALGDDTFAPKKGDKPDPVDSKHKKEGQKASGQGAGGAKKGGK